MIPLAASALAGFIAGVLADHFIESKIRARTAALLAEMSAKLKP